MVEIWLTVGLGGIGVVAGVFIYLFLRERRKRSIAEKQLSEKMAERPPESEEERLKHEIREIRAEVQKLKEAQSPLVTPVDVDALSKRLRLAYLRAERHDALHDRKAEIARAEQILKVLDLENRIKEAVLRDDKNTAVELLSQLQELDKARAEKLRKKLKLPEATT
ncbi:MAG: hypothetical protein QMC93_02975 [Patescibacteria group bacterium]|nr:hypothetical protein [Patescibacteria group bacterium]